MRTQILTPWFKLDCEQERDVFIKFLTGQKIAVEKTDGLNVQLGGYKWTADLLKNIEDDFERYCTSYHEEILIEEFTKLSTIVAMFHNSRESLADYIGRHFEHNNESHKDDDYFYVFTDFFQYTIYFNNGENQSWYLSYQIDCNTLGGDCNGEATVMLDENCKLIVDYKPFYRHQ